MASFDSGSFSIAAFSQAAFSFATEVVEQVQSAVGGWILHHKPRKPRSRREYEYEEETWETIEPEVKRVLEVKKLGPVLPDLASVEADLQAQFNAVQERIEQKNALSRKNEQIRLALVLEGIRRRIEEEIQQAIAAQQLAEELERIRLENIRREETDIVFIISMLAA